MLRTAILSLLPAALIASGWLALEEPPSRASAYLVAALALLPALVRRPLLRGAAALAAALVVVDAALGVSLLRARPFDDDRDFFGPVVSRFRSGVSEFYDVTVPFAPAAHERMHGVVLLAVFGFCLAVALAISFRRPLLAGLALLAGAAWPVTLVAGTNEAGRGALILLAVLVLLAALRPRVVLSAPQAAAGAAVVVACGLAASSSPAVAKEAFLDWQRWDLSVAPRRSVGVAYVWSSDYTGIRFPRKATTVLRIQAPERWVYWRATTLDSFAEDRWVEDARWAFPRDRDGRDDLSADSLQGRRARSARWLRQDVRVEGLVDDHLIGASVPVMYDPGDIPVRYGKGGIAWAPARIGRGDRYTVWSYAATPRARELRRLGAAYPRVVEELELSVAPGIRVPRFGAPGRELRMRSFFAALAGDVRVGSYRALYEAATEVTERSRTPYEAVVALESWFRSAGGFRYDERPPVATAGPPLVDFVVRTRRGYCQHFAGAMALMLRYLGIPSRVAAGFTSGKYDRESGTWTVTDHNAHAWVEAWFPGFGWLPFDPTPGRGALSASYTAASPTFTPLLGTFAALAQAAGVSERLLKARLENDSRRGRRASRLLGEASGDGGGPVTLEQRGQSLLGLLALLAAACLASIVLAKVAVRRARYLTRDPRRVAAACRQEAVDFLRDQGVRLPRSATLRELGSVLESQLSVHAREFVKEVDRARFGSPRASEESARRARRERRVLLRHVRRRLTPFARLRGLLSLRSLGFG